MLTLFLLGGTKPASTKPPKAPKTGGATTPGVNPTTANPPNAKGLNPAGTTDPGEITKQKGETRRQEITFLTLDLGFGNTPPLEGKKTKGPEKPDVEDGKTEIT